jgi:CzcA family heavy metal efflux pump
MTWIVRVALERPLTFIVLALLIMIFGPMAAMKTPTDIFPSIGVPVIAVNFGFTGLAPDEMANRIVGPFERALTTTVDNVQHMESQSMVGLGLVKIYFQPGVDIDLALAQVTAFAQTSLRSDPPGTNPPLILNYDASTVPVLQVAYSSKVLSEQQLFDLAQNTVRQRLTTVRGAGSPYAYGGKSRQVDLELDPQALQAHGLSAQDVQNAVSNQTQIIPVGQVKIGTYQYIVKLNDAADTVDALNDLPVKTVGGVTTYLRDVGRAVDSSAPQLNVVHAYGGRAVLSTILKIGSASTLDVVDGIKQMVPTLRSQLPDSLKIDFLNDQSIFVKAAVSGVVREGIIAAALTSLMILLFLGSWRSTVIIATSIPLAVLSAIIGLWATGQTLNIMTLGGLALAVGILVDDATVTIENINWHLEHGKDVRTAILDGAQQITQPAFVSLLCICIVFVPMFALPGVAGYLFMPLAMSVVFAMIASFILSRTLVPTLSLYLLKPHVLQDATSAAAADHALHRAEGRNFLARLQARFEDGFTKVRETYRNLLALALSRRRPFVIGFLAVVAVSFLLVPFLGSNFFPSIDTGQITLHVRTPAGMRIEDTTQIFGRVEDEVRHMVPRNELAAIVDNIGQPFSSINLTYNSSGLIGEQDGDIFISLNDDHHPSADYVRRLREILPRKFPGNTFSFPPADIVSQILNFGIPAPIDVQIVANDTGAASQFARMLLPQLRAVPGIADPRIQQSNDYPQLHFNADRMKMAQYGLTEKDVTGALATALAGTGQTAPNFWLNPKSGISYSIVAQTPEYQMDTMAELQNLPVTPAAGGTSQTLGALGTFTREPTPAVVSHYDGQATIDIYATTQDRDLGGVARDVSRVMAKNEARLPRGATMVLRGQVVTMNDAFSGLFFGLAGAIVLIYLLIVVNFQSWLDPFVIITALPAALAGIVWTLFATSTTLSVPALTGALMCMGVATANSILVVSFARERLAATGDAMLAAIEAGVTRFRPVMMTALAMIIGMAPMALGLGEGGEQNAPLGRAVIGGLICATCATLLFVPVVFSIVHGRKAAAAKNLGAKSGEVYA